MVPPTEVFSLSEELNQSLSPERWTEMVHGLMNMNKKKREQLLSTQHNVADI